MISIGQWRKMLDTNSYDGFQLVVHLSDDVEQFQKKANRKLDMHLLFVETIPVFNKAGFWTSATSFASEFGKIVVRSST